MFKSVLGLLLVTLLALSWPRATAQKRWGKIDQERTFRLPYGDYLEHWTYGGSTLMEDRKVRFIPQVQKQPAYMWTKKTVNVESWEVILEFGVHGAAPLSTGEGLAFWLVSETGTEGPVYGHSDTFNGLGIFFDSYDSDGNGEAESYVLAMYNDGTKPIDQEGAGIQLGVCFADYRNLPFPAKAKISFDKGEKHLTVGLDIDNSGKFKSCISVKDVKTRPFFEYFGLTVSEYANDFEIFSFLSVDTSQPFTPPVGEESNYVQFEDESADKTAATFEHHAHFHRITTRLDGISERLSTLDNQFRLQFDTMFVNHNRGLEHHVTKLQDDVQSKSDTATEKLESTGRTVNNMQLTLGQLVTSTRNSNQAKFSSSGDDSSQKLTEIKISCATDNHRGATMTAQLKDTVDSLQRRQDKILEEVHATFVELRGYLDDGCSEGPLKHVAMALLGVCIGVGVVALLKRDSSLHLP